MAAVTRPGRRGRRGSQFVEAGLALLPFCALLLLVVDTGWGLFVKSTLQHAVREGVRFGITGRITDGVGHVSSIRSVVKNQAMGLLNGAQGAAIAVRFYDSGTLAVTGSSAGGNLLEVSVENYSFNPLGPLLRSNHAISITVRDADLMEPSPVATP